MGRDVEDPSEVIRRRRKVGASSIHRLEADVDAAPREDGETGERESGSTATPQHGETGERVNGRAEESYNAITVKPQKAIAVSTHEGKTGEQESGETELNDQKITLYLSWRLLEKLETMAFDYRRRVRKRIDHNKLMRLMIERATLDDLL